MRPPAGGDKPRPYNTGYVPFQGPRRGFGGKMRPRRRLRRKGLLGTHSSSARRGRCPHRPAGGCGHPPLRRRALPTFVAPARTQRSGSRVGKGGPAAGVSVRACPEANDPKLGPTLSRCGGCATPHCLPLREKHLAPAAQLLFRLRGSLCGCSARLRASCHAAGWAHGRVAKRPFREKCRWASPSLFFLHVLLAPLCAYPPRF